MNIQAQEKFNIEAHVSRIARSARGASRLVSRSATEQRNQALLIAAETIESSQQLITQQNQIDLRAGHRSGLSGAMLDRLELTPARIKQMATGLRQTAELPDPVGEMSDVVSRPSGIRVGRMRVPLGVIGIIYESRPNVTADCAALCIKSGNAVVLRGGSEAFYSNQVIVQCLLQGLEAAELPRTAVQLIETTDRSAIDVLVSMDEWIDVIVPRGGKGLIERISLNSKIPVIKHLDGVCHVYVDSHADMDKAERIVMNAKTNRYGVCNTAETLLVASSIAPAFLTQVSPLLIEKGVELRGCETSQKLVLGMQPAAESDWYEEYLAPVLAVKVVADLDEAVDHIQKYGSEHTDAIVTENLSNANRFLREVDSSSVMVNASTRFSDGFEYGLGAEIGISTNKLHARGPVGLEGLTMQKYVVFGDGTIRE